MEDFLMSRDKHLSQPVARLTETPERCALFLKKTEYGEVG